MKTKRNKIGSSRKPTGTIESSDKMCRIKYPHDFPDFPCKVCNPPKEVPDTFPLNSEGYPSRNELSLSSLAEYLISNPDQRFFQGLTNWFGVPKIGYFDGKNWIDMWNLEEGVDYKIKKQTGKGFKRNFQ